MRKKMKMNKKIKTKTIIEKKIKSKKIYIYRTKNRIKQNITEKHLDVTQKNKVKN